MAGETPVGGIVGFLRLDNDQFVRAIDEAIVKTEILDGKRVDVEVNVDRTGAAAASIARTERSLDKLDGTTKRVGTSSLQSRRNVGALATAIVTLGPPLVPIAAGALGLAVAFAGMGAAGILAIVGIKKEMESGSAVGLEFQATLKGAKKDLFDLAGVAAANVLAPLQGSVTDLNERMPALRGQVGELATVFGRTGQALVGGLLGGFQALDPLMRDAGVYVLHLTERFEDFMNGPGIVTFGDYVRSVFPQVMQNIEDIVRAVAHLVAAFAPLGVGTLSILGTLAQVISSFPVDVLAVIAQMASGVFVGFKAWSALNVPIGGLIKLLGGVDDMSRRAAVGIRTLQVAAGVIGIVLAGLTFIFAANAESQRKSEQATNDYADALRASNGVIDESIEKMTAQRLADDGVLEAGRKLGINLKDITDAALGVPGAMDRINAVLDAQAPKMTQVASTGRAAAVVKTELGFAADKVKGAIEGENGALESGTQKNKDLTAATTAAAGAQSAAAAAAKATADTYGVSASAYQAAAAGQQAVADKAEQATAKMILENDAAGLLKQSLDALNGEALSAAEAQNAFESSLVNMGTHVNKTGKQITFTTTSIKDMSSASVALRGQLNGQISNLQRVVEANGGLTDSTGKAKAEMVKMRQQIIDNAVAHGVDRDAVTAYIDKILKIPKTVPPTKLDVDKKAAELKLATFQAHVNALKGKTVRIDTILNYITKGDVGIQAAKNRADLADLRLAKGGKIPGYAGGTIVGPGTGTSDSILAMVRETGRVLRVSAGEVVSSKASADRNGPALEAGNRGATLQVAGSGQQSGPLDLSNRTIRKLAQAMSEITLGVDANRLSQRLAEA